MPGIDSDVRIHVPVLDRLIDYEPEASQEPMASRSRNLRNFRRSVRRDLEWLLNTNEFIQEVPPDLKQIEHSLLTYGIPDLTGSNPRHPVSQDQLCNVIARKIAIFEPRLSGVVIRVVPGNEDERSLRLRIEAQLLVDPAPEFIAFDTQLDQELGLFSVKGS